MEKRDRMSPPRPIVVAVIDARRGVLYPARMPEFRRVAPTQDAGALSAWFWIPEWDIEPGRSSRQHIVAYPALNLVVGAEGVELAGATTRAGFRDLTGRGWAVGALLRPAAVSALVENPAALIDRGEPFDAPDLHAAVGRVMSGDDRHERAAAVFSAWLADRVGAITPVAAQANEMADLLMTDATVLRAEEAAARLSMSLRTLQRLAHRHVGLPPAAMIRRRRLQEAAQRIRDDPDADLAQIAAELGYADHSHLSNDFRAVLGVSPRAYRADQRPADR